MKQLLMKARSGVTLVELLVVILIVTILSVSMLPLLQPFVTEAQYAAEPIPVIGNLRTKIGLYQYNKGYLPNYYSNNPKTVMTWMRDETDPEKYVPTLYAAGSDGKISGTPEESTGESLLNHIQRLIDVDWQELKGKRSFPSQYEYYVISATNYPSYVVACFGDGVGLKAGTGYAVCELNYKNKKFIGTWSRYKPYGIEDEDTKIVQQLHFGTTAPSDDNGEKLKYCYVPDPDDFDPTSEDHDDGLPSEVQNMIKAGWEF